MIKEFDWESWKLSKITTHHHKVCGIHSGIPECCINWYIGPWTVISSLQYLRNAYWTKNEKYRDINYIRCPNCIDSGKIVQIKKCECYEVRS